MMNTQKVKYDTQMDITIHTFSLISENYLFEEPLGPESENKLWKLATWLFNGSVLCKHIVITTSYLIIKPVAIAISLVM